MKLIITGDLFVNRPYNASDLIDKKIIELFEQSDYNIVNLEAPITNSESKILKSGPNLKAHKEGTLLVLKQLKINAVTLANNHLGDFGEQGVLDTLDFCKKNNIDVVGAGTNVKKAREPLYIDNNEGKIAIINFTENEWGAATEDAAGFNPMDVIENSYQIREAKNKADYVIVIVHGGHEYYNLPSPRMQKQYRFYAEQGADIIIGHHTHCISGYEEHQGVPIYYSLGNFLFTKNSRYDDWYTGKIMEIEITDGKLSHQYYSVEMNRDNFGLKPADQNSILNRVDSYSKIISDEKLLKSEWHKYIEQQRRMYLYYWSPLVMIKNKHIRRILSKLNIRLTSKNGMALYLNLMRCEAHRDLSKEIIGKQIIE